MVSLEGTIKPDLHFFLIFAVFGRSLGIVIFSILIFILADDHIPK
jgi:hypothetical protein